MTMRFDAHMGAQKHRKKVAGFRGRREEHARELSRNAMYAIHHPKLCESMPHRFFPYHEGAALCIRCGATEYLP